MVVPKKEEEKLSLTSEEVLEIVHFKKQTSRYFDDKRSNNNPLEAVRFLWTLSTMFTLPLEVMHRERTTLFNCVKRSLLPWLNFSCAWSWTWSAVKVLWLNVPFTLYWFYRVPFLDTISNTCFMSSLMRCVLSSHASLRCLWCHRQSTKLSVLQAGRERNACGLHSVL